MLRRNIKSLLQEAAKQSPVLLIQGPRQAGKNTLVRSTFETHQYFTLNDPTILTSIKNGSTSFLAGLKFPTIINEVQRAPELFLSLKKVVDKNRRPGFFVLISSANILSLPKLAESLTGHVEIHTLWPFSQGEILDRKEGFIENIFSEKFEPFDISISLETLAEKIIKGGYSAAITRENPSKRNAWFKDYLTTLLEKDIQALCHIERLSEMPNLLNFLAFKSGFSLNTLEISRTLNIPYPTLTRYLSLLETIFIVNYLPGWLKNPSKKPTKSSKKVYLNDTGLLAHILSLNEEKLLSQKIFFDHILENFVVMEILKQQTWSKIPFKVSHYRTNTGQKVDLLLEATDGRIIGIEIKPTNHLDQNDFKGLEFLEKSVGKNFYRGLVLYMGDKALPFGKNKYAVPLPVLWEM